MKYAYIEITERCNFCCPFCPSATLQNSRGEMSAELFQNVLQKLSGNVEEIFLHVLGEPLLHSEFPRILQIAESFQIPVNLTTNGSLIAKNSPLILRSKIIRQINFSTHAYAYLPREKALEILQQTLDFTDALSNTHPEVYVNFRLWNDHSDAISRDWNSIVLQKLTEYFHVPLCDSEFSVRRKSTPICGRIYIHRDSRFEWPNGKAEENENGTCHGVKDQCAILFDGRVVPCCLDYRGQIVLGKFPENSFAEIFEGIRATQMRNGFLQHKLTESFCRRCAFAKRFANTRNVK